MSRPFVDESDNYHPEAIVAFMFLVFMGFMMGLVIGWLI